jgi:bifunctional non-homologous end joining protein LigD
MSTSTARTRLARDQRRPDGFIKPFLLTLADKAPAGPDWQFEVKHDGWRIIARVADGRARMWSRHGLDWTKAFSSVAAGLVGIGRDLILDGEAVCQNEDGSSDFHALSGPAGCARATLWAFDLLALDREDLRARPLEERRDKLQRLLANASVLGIEFSDHATGDGERMYEAACRMGLEGIVAKRKGSRYVSGRCRHWLKIKNPAFVRPNEPRT